MGVQRKIRRGIRKAGKIPGIQFRRDEATGKFLPPKRWPELTLLTPAFIAAHLPGEVLKVNVYIDFEFEGVDRRDATYRLREYNAETRAFIAEQV